jgi:hypothetical protein
MIRTRIIRIPVVQQPNESKILLQMSFYLSILRVYELDPQLISAKGELRKSNPVLEWSTVKLNNKN